MPAYLISNACRVTNKVDELQAVVEASNANVAIITESWLDSNIPSSAISLGNTFNIYRKDRTCSQGGGVLAYVSESIPTKHLSEFEVDDKEVLWLLHTPPRIMRPFSCIITVALYFPEFRRNIVKESELNNYITERLGNLLKERPSAGIVITGDINQLDPRPLCRRFDLRKIVKAPTRGNNILDQILTNMGNIYGEAQHLPPLGRSDHQCILYAPLKHRPTGKPSVKTTRSLKADNIRALGLKLNHENWESVFQAKDVDEKVEAFNNILIEALNTCTPQKRVRMHPGDKEWMTPHIKGAISARQKAFSKGDKERYKQMKEKVANLIKNAKRKFYETKASDFRMSNPRKWYKSIYALCGAERQRTTPTAPSSDELKEVADKLLQAFTAPWKNRTATALLASEISDRLQDRPPPLPSIGQVKAIMKHLNGRKATGCDEVPAWLLKSFHEEIAPALHDIICASIQQCKYPTAYKHALISPVPKVSNPADINNDFRQISVLPQAAKVLEKIQLMLNKRNMKIDATQHAFQEKRSTVTALTSITQDWFNATEPTSPFCGVHALFLDFRKAFDLVDHAILLEKLATMNISRSFWNWVQSYLSGRTLQVKLPGVVSCSGEVIAGVPQGGVISPTLFNVFINDIDDCYPPGVSINTCKYADDCTQYELVPTGSESHMHDVMVKMEAWAERNKMEINAKKTKEMWICFKKSQQIHVPSPIRVGNEELERVEVFKLLGVHVQRDLKWNTHIDEIVTKASKRLYFLRACRKANLPTEVGLTTYITKIRPLLEYASPIWGGIPNYLAEDLQRIQNRSLDILGLARETVEPLDVRRDSHTAHAFKEILDSEGLHPCCKFLISRPQSYSLRAQRVRVPIPRTNRNMNSFIQRGTRLLGNKSYKA